jgi:hypothetical protein
MYFIHLQLRESRLKVEQHFLMIDTLILSETSETHSFLTCPVSRKDFGRFTPREIFKY